MTIRRNICRLCTYSVNKIVQFMYVFRFLQKKVILHAKQNGWDYYLGIYACVKGRAGKPEGRNCRNPGIGYS